MHLRGSLDTLRKIILRLAVHSEVVGVSEAVVVVVQRREALIGRLRRDRHDHSNENLAFTPKSCKILRGPHCYATMTVLL